MIRNAHAAEWDDVYEGDSVAEEEGLDLLGFLLRRKWLIVLGTVVGTILGLLLYARAEPVYESSAQMLIQEKVNALPLQSGNRSPIRFAAARIDHAFVLDSPLVVTQAVETQSLSDLPSLVGVGNPVGTIRGGLSIAPAKKSASVLELSFRGPNPEDCPQILDALIATYREFLITSETNVSQETSTLIENAEQNLTNTLEDQIQNYEAFQATAPLLWKDGEAGNIYLERQAQIEQKRNQVALQNGELAAKIQSIEAGIQRGVSHDILLALAKQGGRSPGSLGDKDDLDAVDISSLLIDLKTMSHQYGQGHPKIKSLLRRIAAIEEFQQESRDAREAKAAADANETPDEDEIAGSVLQVHLAVLQEQLVAGEQQLVELEKMSEAEQDDAKRLSAYLSKDQEHQDRIERTKKLFDAVVQRLQEINLIDDAMGGDRYKVQVLSAAGRGRKVEPSLVRFSFSGVALGLLVGCGLAYVIDRADQTFRSPEDVSQALNLPLIGQIAEMSDKDRQVPSDSILDAALVTAHRPKSVLAESYRAVRTSLYFSTHSKEHQVIQVTSPIPGDGKSTLTANLAITIAQSGKRVLLLDADFRRPVVHQRFGLSADVGLASVVDGQMEPPQAIQETAVQNLWAMACGPRPDNPSELLTSPRFDELLQLLRDQFDFVLVDTPPLLAVTDPSVVAARVDGVILTTKLHNRARSLAIQARNMLREMDAKVLGVVVNGVGEGKKAYGAYGKYRYSYRYGYANYGDSDPQEAIKGYYDDHDESKSNGKEREARGERRETRV